MASPRTRIDAWDLKALYDALTGPALAATLAVAALAWALHLLARALAALAGTEPAAIWLRAGAWTGIDDAWIRLIVFGAAHLAVILALRRPAARILERLRPARPKRKRRKQATAPHRVPVPVRRAAGVVGTAITTALLVAFLLQPTLVPLRVDRQAWLDRAANLVDGTASALLVDSAVWLARAAYAPPNRARALVDAAAFDADLDAAHVPLMDRWDELLLRAADGDRELFAQTKAFMWVESGGRQFAVSATGCSGLMQFCASTAQRRPFHTIFGTGQVSACGCTDCGVPRAVQIALETDPDAVLTQADAFPCPLSDARFDAEKSIAAGVAFVRELSADAGGNLPLMYVGYNAGPAVSRRLHRQLGSDVSIAGLERHLADALRPYYGDRAAGRAAGLIQVHLPKLTRAYERWR
jgi:soluble lytic murein transglycosylase-like protein